MQRYDIKISFECPRCKQINDDVSLGKAIDVEVGLQYIGTGEYFPVVEEISLYCSGCKLESLIEM